MPQRIGGVNWNPPHFSFYKGAKLLQRYYFFHTIFDQITASSTQKQTRNLLGTNAITRFPFVRRIPENRSPSPDRWRRF
jgi:hypothetical protein